jgi:hypothetical protein
MKTETTEQILQALSNRFGTTINHLHEVMLRQAMLDGIEASFALVALTIATALTLVTLKKEIAKTKNWEFEDNMFLCIMSFVLSMCWLFSVLMGGAQIIDCFFNPEYYALHQILKGR